MELFVFSPSGVIAEPAALRRSLVRLRALGFDARADKAALARSQRFAGSDEARLAALHRVAEAAPAVAMASRGGYGVTRLLDRIDWQLLARSVERGTRWVGHSDFTALQLALLAHTGAVSWAGPMACYDFGRAEEEHAAAGVESVDGKVGKAFDRTFDETFDEALDDVTAGCFGEAMRGELHAVGFRTEAGFDGLEARGLLWGGNLAMLVSLLGTSHLPPPARVKGGLLFLEDVNEHPYRVERMLLQLLQAGVLGAQKAVLLGHFTDWAASPLDRGYGMKSMLAQLRAQTRVPILTGLPFGHVPTKVTLPVGRRATLAVLGRDAFVGWEGR
jgi:muramoyltetrapeptide carboxypeptidase